MNKIKDVFTVMGEFLVDRLKLDRPGKGTSELHQELVSLSSGRRTAVRKYYVRKTAVFLATLTAGMIFTLIGFFAYLADRNETEVQSLARPGYGEGDRKEELTVQVEGEEDGEQVEITVQERKYTDEEKQRLLDRALERLEELLPGENESLDQVKTDLYFPAVMEDGAVKLSWLTIPYGVIGEDGSLKESEDENGTLVEIQGTLTCGGREAVYTAFARVFPPDLPEQERFYQSVRREVELADAGSSAAGELELPGSVEGKNLTWTKPRQNPVPSLLAMTLILAAAVYLEMDSSVHRRAEERKNQLMLDYPDLMWKLNMLLGAGLSMKGAFSRISEEYLREKREERGKRGRKEKERIKYVYEEVTYTCYEMKSGIPEAQAYERFGKRCQLPEYIRLGSVLSQNLKKGAKGLTALLETEAESSLNDRRNHARKIGEQAGTKLLLPMVLMLGVVLVILMVPAFLSF